MIDNDIKLGPRASRAVLYILENTPPPTPKLVEAFQRRKLSDEERAKMQAARDAWDARYEAYLETLENLELE